MGKKTRQPTNDEIIASFDNDSKAFALWLRQNPIAFCKYICGLTPHRAQEEFLNLSFKTSHVMLPWGRQFGKSTIVAFYIAHLLFSQPNYSAFLFAPSGDQTKIIF